MDECKPPPPPPPPGAAPARKGSHEMFSGAARANSAVPLYRGSHLSTHLAQHKRFLWDTLLGVGLSLTKVGSG